MCFTIVVAITFRMHVYTCVVTPCACARGKAIGYVVVIAIVVVVTTKIAISRDVGV